VRTDAIHGFSPHICAHDDPGVRDGTQRYDFHGAQLTLEQVSAWQRRGGVAAGRAPTRHTGDGADMKETGARVFTGMGGWAAGTAVEPTR